MGSETAEWLTGPHAPESTWLILGKVTLVLWSCRDEESPRGAAPYWRGRIRIENIVNAPHPTSATVEFYLPDLGKDLPKAKGSIILAFKDFSKIVSDGMGHL